MRMNSVQRTLEDKLDTSLAPRLMLAALPAFLIGFVFGLGKIVRDCSLTCNVGYRLVPLAILAVGLASLPISSLTVRLAGRLGYKRWQVLSLSAIGFSFFIFWGVTYFILTVMADTTQSGTPSSVWTFPLGLVYLLFFVWLGALGAALKPNLKSTVYRMFPRAEQAKALAVTTAAVVLGGLIGAWLAGIFAPAVMLHFQVRYELARDSLILIMGLMILLTVPVMLIIAHVTRTSSDSPDNDPQQEDLDTQSPTMNKGGLRRAVQLLSTEAKLKRMAYLILITGAAETFMLYLFYWLVSDQVPGTSGRTLFFSDFYILLNAFTLLFLIFGTNRVINRYGLVFALAAMPITLVFGSAYLLYNTVVASIYALRIIYSSLEQSLYGQGLDRLILDVGQTQAPLVRPVLHGLTIRLGRGLGAILVLALALGAGLSFVQLTMIFMGLLIAWILIAFSLKKFLHRSSPAEPSLHHLRSTE